MESTNIILFDIDFTLLNTSSMMKNLCAMIEEESKISTTVISRIICEYEKSLLDFTYFNFLDVIERLPTDNIKKKRIRKRYLYDHEIYTKLPGVVKTIKCLTQRGYKLGIFSEGVPDFQKNKLKNLQIDDYIQDDLVYISQSKRSDDFLNAIPKAVIVDDNVDVCNIIQHHGRHKPIHIDVKQKTHTHETTQLLLPDVSTVGSLERIISLFVSTC